VGESRSLVTAPTTPTRWGPSPDCAGPSHFARRYGPHFRSGDTGVVNLATTAPTSTLRRVAALTGAVAFAVLTIFMWHSTRPMRWERPIIRAAAWMPLPSRDFWIAVFQPVPFALTTVALGAVAAVRGRHRLALTGIAGCLGAVVAAQVVFKPLVDRIRTHVAGDDHHLVRVGSRLFPSTHVTAAAAWAMFAILIFGQRTRLTRLLFALPLVVGCAVLSLELHYPADVVGGFLLGSTFVYFTVDLACTVDRARARRESHLAAERLVRATTPGGAGTSSPPTARPRGPTPASPREGD
jgi:membrane-associated phospholipid phosphatase